MLLTLHGFWTVALYFGLLGIIWLPRYYVIPTQLRLWPSYWVYTSINADSTPPISAAALTDKRVYPSQNFTLNVDYKHECFTCNLIIKPKHCSTLVYSDLLFDPIHTSLSYEVYTYESYPCYQNVDNKGSCSTDDPSNVLFSGAGCTLCSLCQKDTISMFNLTASKQYRKYSYTPRFSLTLPTSKHMASKSYRSRRFIMHCLNKLVLLRYYSQQQFCEDLQSQLSVYKHDKTTVFTGCSSFCADSSNVVHRELYNTELGVYLIILAVLVLCMIGLYSCINYVWSLYKELGILNLQWNSSLTCPICMDKLYRFTRISTLRCGHMFCRGCLNQWLYIFCHVTCPLCRQPVDPNTSPRLSTRDEPEGPLMLSDTAHSESDETESVAESDVSTTTAFQRTLMQSIYNIGWHVVSHWSHAGHDTSQMTMGTPESDIEDAVSPHDVIAETLLTSSARVTSSRDVILTTADISGAIPLPYYPIFSSSSSTSIIVPYNPSTSLTNMHCSTTAYSFQNLSGYHDTVTTTRLPRHGYHDTNLLDTQSDTELMGSSSRLQNRIARKINRLKSRRTRSSFRRAQSTSDIASYTSQSDQSEIEH